MSARPPLNVAIGELLWDLLPTGARLGGTTTNYAILSARLGQHSALVSCLGDDELGHEAMERLCLLAVDPSTDIYSNTQFDLSNVQVSSELPTGTVAVTLDDEGRPHYDIVTPSAWDAIALSPALLQTAANASVICYGTLAQRSNVSRETIRGFVAAAGADCARVCDLNLRKPFCNAEVLQWSLAHADVVKVSDEELSEVGRLLDDSVLASGLPQNDGLDLTKAAVRAAERLLQLAPHCRLVAVTLGPHGSLLVNRFGVHRHPGYRVKVVDTIGAGDAFTAGMVHAYTHHALLPQINDVANRCGSYVASQPGATPRLPEDLIASIRETLNPSRQVPN
ncbi:MAG: PfkB family carbohydrate kinase [Acidobacteriaceae bacterium]